MDNAMKKSEPAAGHSAVIFTAIRRHETKDGNRRAFALIASVKLKRSMDTNENSDL